MESLNCIDISPAFSPASGDRAVLGRYALGSRATALGPTLKRSQLRSGRVWTLLFISRIEKIEDPHCLGQQFIVGAGPFPRSSQNGLETPGVGHGDAPDVEKVDCSADRDERRIVIQPEAREQHLESHAVSRVREFGALKIEANGISRTVPRALDPGELGLAVDEALDQPSAREPVDPWAAAGRPSAILEFRRIEAPDAFFGCAGLAARIQLLSLHLKAGKRILGLRFRRPGEEIAFRELLEGAAQALHQRLSPAQAEPRQRGL